MPISSITTIKNGIVNSNIPHEKDPHPHDSIKNINKLIGILERNDIMLSDVQRENILSTKINPLEDNRADNLHSICFDHNKLLNGDYYFEDKRSHIKYTVDINKTLIITDVLVAAKGEKKTNYSIKSAEFDTIKIEPLTADEYKIGLPFLLSCKTEHCDIIGGFGANYPLAEYLSDDGISCKITDSTDYVGHINVWQDSSNNLILGTLAVQRDHVKSKVLNQLLRVFSKQLLEDNPKIESILLGMGGQNLSILYPNSFSPDTNGYELLGRIRHQIDIQQKYPDEVKSLQEITRLGVYGQIEINDQQRIGMEPNDRLDMKNLMSFMDREEAKKIEYSSKALLAELKSQRMFYERKIDRGNKWEKIKDNGVAHRQSHFNSICKQMEKDGITDIRLERSQGQDIIISSVNALEKLPYRIFEQKKIDGRFFIKIRVTKGN